LWVAGLKSGKARVIAQQPVVEANYNSMAPGWSPDSRYLAYTVEDDDFFRSLEIYDIGNGSTHRVTDGMADVR
jgi:tricorn protease